LRRTYLKKSDINYLNFFKEKREERKRNYDRILSKTTFNRTTRLKTPSKNKHVIKTHLSRENYAPMENKNEKDYLSSITTLFNSLTEYVQKGRMESYI
jgi:hypothetical protein